MVLLSNKYKLKSELLICGICGMRYSRIIGHHCIKKNTTRKNKADVMRENKKMLEFSNTET